MHLVSGIIKRGLVMGTVYLIDIHIGVDFLKNILWRFLRFEELPNCQTGQDEVLTL